MSSRHSVFTSGNTAVISGGASGVGFALAKKCVGFEMNVAICDINAENLESAVGVLKNGGKTQVEGVVVDVGVGVVGDYVKVRKVVEERFDGKISLLVLNAGMGIRTTTPWEDPTYFEKTFQTNIFGITNGLCVLLPLVLSQSSPSTPTSIIITGSKQGITNPPGNPAYNASKAAVKSITENLALNLTTKSPSTSVHLLVPGWTFTGMTGNVGTRGGGGKEKPAGAWWPEQVADYLERKMGEGQFYVVCPDGDVSEEMDRKRMLWDRLDLEEGRQPLTRWREEWKEAEKR
ncbi:hypothetical protein HYALB_00000758 [Hymenoscyphus albidus]|uniref:NAD(P)-binding protein n=1 Tax=Hymenoscyphus albidus TaxID=595503 RepID=A0A9N9LT07_9HELO|nr:hypothetical protein HYALB_00000758 [Hymenoscyphus albidus]